MYSVYIEKFVSSVHLNSFLSDAFNTAAKYLRHINLYLISSAAVNNGLKMTDLSCRCDWLTLGNNRNNWYDMFLSLTYQLTHSLDSGFRQFCSVWQLYIIYYVRRKSLWKLIISGETSVTLVQYCTGKWYQCYYISVEIFTVTHPHENGG